MERARPTRSGIPTFVRLNGGLVHSQGQERGDTGLYHSTARISSLPTQSSIQSKKSPSNPPQTSPCPQRGRPAINNGHVDSSENWELRTAKSVGPPGICQTPKHRPPPWRSGVTQARVDQSDSDIHFERESSDPIPIGPKRSSNIHLQMTSEHSLEANNTYVDNHSSVLGQHDASHEDPDPFDVDILPDHVFQSSKSPNSTRDVILNTTSPEFTCDELSVLASTLTSSVSVDNPSVNTSSTRDALQKYVNENSSAICAEAVGDVKKAVNPAAVTPHTTTRASCVSDMDYPIRGVICPLTNTVAIKRSVGNVDEVSFVFGRPASPTSDHLRCRPHQSFTKTDITRCASSSPVRYIPGHYPRRSKSPSSDILPMRRGIALGAYPARRVLSPPSVLGVGSAAEPRMHQQGGICCERCNGCLVELKRQALRLMFPDNGSGGHLAQITG